MKTLAGLLLAAVGVAGGAAFAVERINTIVAVVNETPITRLEVEREASRLLLAERKLAVEEAAQQALDELINRRVQVQRAQQTGIIISDDVLERRLAELAKEFNLPNVAALQNITERRFLMSYAEFRKRVREDIQIQALFYREVFSRTEAYEDEIEQFLKFEAGAASRREYHLRHILLATATDGNDIEEKRQAALSLRAVAQEGEDFSALARQYSDDDTAAGGGDLGFLAEAELPEAFLTEVQDLEAGDISGVISTSRGFHLLMLVSVRGGELLEAIKRVRLSHIFFPLAAEEQALQIWRGLIGEEDFLRAVQRHSTDEVSIEKGGDIGWFDEQNLPSYFADAVSQMQVGDLSRPLQSPFGWHILYLSDAASEKVDLPRLREQARQVLRERRALAQREVWLRQLRNIAQVRILDPKYTSTS